MALTTQISEAFERGWGYALVDELRRMGCNHLAALKRGYNVHEDKFIWVWKTQSGNTGRYYTEEPKPTSEELTAMFAAIKLTD